SSTACPASRLWARNCVKTWRTVACAPACGHVSTAKTIRTYAAGLGRTEAGVAAVLVVNAGSTSLKLSTVDVDGSTSPVESLAAAPADVVAGAHRVVHGGTSFRGAVRIDERVEEELTALTELAPLHNAPAVAAI